MDNDELYWNACYPKTVTVCGITLRPFSVGHGWHLRSVGSPFVSWDDVGTFHFLLALWICSNAVSSELPTHNRKLPLHFWFASKVISWMSALVRPRIEPEVAKLAAYIDDSLNFRPPVASKDDKLCRQSTCPSLLPMKRVLMTVYGYSEHEFLNMPLKKAKWEHHAWLESEGVLKFITQDDLNLIKYMLSPAAVERNKKFWEENRTLKKGGKNA